MKDRQGEERKPSTLDCILAGLALSLQFVIAAVILVGLLHLIWGGLTPAAMLLAVLGALLAGVSLPFLSPRLTRRFLVFFSQYTLS
ncbi:MAG: hypothetical protein AAF394_08910 [Planctomycetota bacterium]